MPRPARRHVLVLLLIVTLAVLALDRGQAGEGIGAGAAGGGLRSASATVFGPLERLLTAGRPSAAGAAAVQHQVDASRATAQAGMSTAFDAVLAVPALAGARVLPARVVAVGRQGAGGPERVTLDVGSRDGVRVDQGVVDAQGLVGRVVSLGPWTADVALVGGPDVVAGVRVGAAGALGSVSSGASGATRRTAGLLNLTLVQRGRVRPGDVVTTLGSVGGSPFPPGLPVGTVTSVDASPGDLAPTAAVRPAVDVTTVDVVGVLLSAPRTSPRPASTAGR